MVVSPILLSNYGLISKQLISQRSVKIAAMAIFVPPARGFKREVYKWPTYDAILVNKPSTLPRASHRNYVTKKTEPLQATPPPTPPNLPQREQIERACFRVIALCWDCGFFIIAWLRKVINTHVVADPTVQHYWKRFHEKMAESKKND